MVNPGRWSDHPASSQEREDIEKPAHVMSTIAYSDDRKMLPRQLLVLMRTTVGLPSVPERQ